MSAFIPLNEAKHDTTLLPASENKIQYNPLRKQKMSKNTSIYHNLVVNARGSTNALLVLTMLWIMKQRKRRR